MHKLFEHPIIRVLFFWAVFFTCLVGFSAFPPIFPGSLHYLFGGTLLGGVSLLLVLFLLKRERTTPDRVGLQFRKSHLGHFFGGTVAGMGVVGLMIGTLTLLSPLRIESVAAPDYWNAIGWSAFILFVLALMEELAFRTYPLFRLSKTLGFRSSIYITAVVFAFYHGLSPMNLLGPGIWGLFFGLAAIRTGSIVLPLGFHFGLNWMQSLFGMKPEYSGSLWTIEVDSATAHFSQDTVGLALHLILMVIGVGLIEWHVRKKD